MILRLSERVSEGDAKFQGFCGRWNKWEGQRKPVAKRMTRTLKRIKEELRRRMHHGVEETGKWLGQVLNRWLNYFAVPTSHRSLRRFAHRLTRLWLKRLRRRSQKDRYSRA